MQSREFVAEARLALCNGQNVIAELCEHMREHDAEVSVGPDGHIIRLGDVRADITVGGSSVFIRITAPDLESLYFARLSVASHIVEFSGLHTPDIVWVGDGNEIVRPPNFHIFELVARRNITPHMLRLTFATDKVECFAGLDALHINLMIQHPDVTEPQWPNVDKRGVVSWEIPDLRPAMRKYTVRSIDRVAGTLDIDFVLHADAGPGSKFAHEARIGDRIGAIGPGGGGLVQADWHLFIGDETALPAIARIMEHLPLGSRGKAIMEVADKTEVQELVVPAGFGVKWLFREDQLNQRSQLADAVKKLHLPSDDEKIHVWAGCEFDAFREIRSFLRKERCLTNAQHLVVSYWRKGQADDD